MLCRKFKQIITKSTWSYKFQYCSTTKLSKRCVLLESLLSVYKKDGSMSSFRLILKDLSVTRIWGAWSRSYLVSTVVRRCRKDRGVREVIQKFKQTFLRPRQTLLLSATAAFKSNTEEPDEVPTCSKNITDEDLQNLLQELDGVELLSKSTLFCATCDKRLVIDRKHPGVTYCTCKEPTIPDSSGAGGWDPYMEADGVIVWRKGLAQGQYAYKVYGRYKEVKAEDFAAVQVDGAYRRVWDDAVASLSVVERQANGVLDQTVLHWEVLWPRLFANRDYVYIRRNKEFEVGSTTPAPHKNTIFNTPPERTTNVAVDPQRPNVHTNAKRKSMELELAGEVVAGTPIDNDKVFIIASRSCKHDSVPETKHVIRVRQFWSHMVIKSLSGTENPGMEFVLTYYDEPAAGGLPTGVAAWATGRAAPVFLERMRRAANKYKEYRAGKADDLPDYIPFGPEKTSFESEQKKSTVISEQDMESSKQGPEMDSDDVTRQDESTQTDDRIALPLVEAKDHDKHTVKECGEKDAQESEGDSDNAEEDENGKRSGSWYRYLYPFYYFV